MPEDGHAGRVTLPMRKRLNHRGPLSINVSSAWYFITLCAEGHAPWVGSRVPRDRDFASAADSILSAARWYHEHGKWRLALFLVMPDHLHFIAHFPSTCGHAGRVTLPMVSIIQHFKSYLVRNHGLRFQRDFFDTRIRDDAHYAEKFSYILGNPVRRDLCATPEEWPYSIAFNRTDGSEVAVSAWSRVSDAVGSRVPRAVGSRVPDAVGSRVPRDRAGQAVAASHPQDIENAL